MKIGTGLSLPVGISHCIAGNESHLVGSRNPVWIAWGFSHCRLPTCPFAGWVLCGSLPGPHRTTPKAKAAQLPGQSPFYQVHLGQEGACLPWSPQRELSSCLCFALCALLATGNSFTTSSGGFWGKVYWACIECGHETSLQSLEQAPFVQNLGVNSFIANYYACSQLLHVWGGDRLKKKPSSNHYPAPRPSLLLFRMCLNPDLSTMANLHLLSDHPVQTEG